MEQDYSYLQDKKILITGGLGFVGVNLVKKLLAMDIEPTIMDFTSDLRSIDKHYIPFDLDSLPFYNIDIRQSEKVVAIVQNISPDFVIHLAGMTNLEKTFEKAELAIDINLKGSLAILKGSKKTNLNNFVFLSTSDIYGGINPPFREDQLAQPASPYSASKAATEMFLIMFYNVYKIPVTILRSFNLYGKYQPPERVIPFIIKKLLNNEEVPLTKGEQKREFNYVDDLLDAILRSLFFKNSQGKILNIGSGLSISIKEIAMCIAKKIGKVDKLKIGALQYRENEIWDMYCDNSLARNILNWEPKVSLDEGLEKTIEWYRSIK
ncbi:MAG: GDP-mannose 4,6-dehydratase [Candidatus Bathyarchaeia archaeon]|jgi:UDP-glucose 4-epimerase